MMLNMMYSLYLRTSINSLYNETSDVAFNCGKEIWHRKRKSKSATNNKMKMFMMENVKKKKLQIIKEEKC